MKSIKFKNEIAQMVCIMHLLPNKNYLYAQISLTNFVEIVLFV